MPTDAVDEFRTMPGGAAFRLARDLLRRRFHIPACDIEDVLSDAVVSLLSIDPARVREPDALFVTLAQRRACDYVRRRAASRRPLEEPEALAPDESRADFYLIERALQRHPGQKAFRVKVIRLLRDLESGASVPEALDAASIPRGSRQRYRAALQALGETLAGRASPQVFFPHRAFRPPPRDK
jgi:DNA-directed RNA polymerase specialized sigma24 family protein